MGITRYEMYVYVYIEWCLYYILIYSQISELLLLPKKCYSNQKKNKKLTEIIIIIKCKSV